MSITVLWRVFATFNLCKNKLRIFKHNCLVLVIFMFVLVKKANQLVKNKLIGLSVFTRK